jgi:hypothetical protein
VWKTPSLLFGWFRGSDYAPPTQAALYDLDRFLGLLAAGFSTNGAKTISGGALPYGEHL